VRGTAHQIIERYEQMANDARLAGDPVAAENCLQHVEHYVRRLEATKRAEDARREEQARRMRERQAELAATLPENSESSGRAIAIEPKAEGCEGNRIQARKHSSQQDTRKQRLLEAGEAFGKAL
jgi:sRNA-binding protein